MLGVSALWLPAAVDRNSAKRDGTSLIVAAVAIVALMQLDEIGRLAGLALVAGLAVYICVSLNGAQLGDTETVPTSSGSEGGLGRDVFNTAVGVLALALGAYFLVPGAVGIANQLGVSETLVGIVLLALGTSLPEFSVTVAALARGKGGLALGNVLGSTLFNLLGILGITALIKPLVVLDSVAAMYEPQGDS